MLTPEYLYRVAEGSEEFAAQLHEYILESIIARAMARLGRGEEFLLTATDKWQIEVLQDAGYLLEDIRREIAKRMKNQQQEVKEAMEEAGVRALAYDDAVYREAGLSPVPLWQSPHMVRLMQRNYEATMGTMKNFTRTLAGEAQKLFVTEVDKAYNLVTSGAVSYTQAVMEAVEAIAEEGVTVVYPSGKKDTVETAVLRAVRTGIAQSTGEIQIARMIEMDWDIILVSSHLGARTGDGGPNPGNHFWWQGKFYTRTGRTKEYPDFYDSTGYGSIEGLDGVNCRHSFGPGDGIHNPFEEFDSEENRKREKLNNRQRFLERRIRKNKRELMGLKAAVDGCGDEKLKFELQQIYDRKAGTLQEQNEAYHDFCKTNNLKELNDRLHIAKWNREQASAARGAAKRHKDLLALEKKHDIIKSEIKAAGIRGEIELNPKKLDLSDYKFDDIHINQERGHDVSFEEAKQFMKEAEISVTKWKGKFTNYFGKNGAVYVDNETRMIRTSFKSIQYDETTKKMMEVLKKWQE